MRYIPKRPKVEDVGLQEWLDTTKSDHNDLNYSDFVRLVESGLDKANLAKAFQVGRDTIYRWLDIYQKEKT